PATTTRNGAIARLLADYRGLLLREARRRLPVWLQKKCSAEDVVQTVSLRLVTALKANRDEAPRFPNEGALIGYLVTSTRNVIHDLPDFYGGRRRDIKRERSLESLARDSDGEELTPAISRGDDRRRDDEPRPSQVFSRKEEQQAAVDFVAAARDYLT